MLALDTRQSQAYAQAITYTIIITTLVAAGITSVSVFVINRGIHKRHLAVQRSLQTEVEKRTEQLQIANNHLLVANEQLNLHDRMQQEFINVAAHELRTTPTHHHYTTYNQFNRNASISDKRYQTTGNVRSHY
ncbi:MAG: hypothetical protein WBE68_15210 [Candidatus Nitrosopolaris sp.]